jgi:hypothetical protein
VPSPVRIASLLALIGALLLVWAPLARAQTPSMAPDPTAASDPLAASLLAEADLPGFVGRDLDDPSDLDIDRVAFDEQRGIETRIRAWVSQEEGVVFDYRMRFPTPDAALAYLATAEPTLSEAADAGLVLDASDPLTAATRHWTGETSIGDEPVAMDVWLIPVGPVVAKVAATLFGTGLDQRLAIAERALARLEGAYGPADPGVPPDSPGTSPIASPTEPDPPTLGEIPGRPFAELMTLWRGARFLSPFD